MSTMPRAELMMVPVGKIVRHPTAQRPAQPKKYLKKIGGEWEADKAGVAILSRDGNGGFLAIDRAHGIEQAQLVMGPRWKMPALVYQEPLSEEQAAALFVSTDNGLKISTGVKHDISIKAKDGEAVFVESQRIRLPRCRTVGAFYTALNAHGEAVLKQTVDMALKIWGAQSDFPGSLIAGLAQFAAEAKNAAEVNAATKRIKGRKKTTSQWLDRARTRQAQHGGHGNLPGHLRTLFRGR